MYLNQCSTTSLSGVTMKTFPCTKEQIQTLTKKFPTPFHIYDEEGIVKNGELLKAAFSDMNFKEFFAVKALPNPFILKIMKRLGFGADCSSLAELLLCEKVGITGEQIMFTSNETPAKEYVKAYELGAIINLDDISHIEYLQEALGGKLPELISFRYNPGAERTGNAIIGNPKEAKFGVTKEQLFEAYRTCKELGVKRFGLHTMVVSNELNNKAFVDTAQMLVALVNELEKQLDITFEFINLGGGIGIPYKPEQQPVDYKTVVDGVKEAVSMVKHPLKIYLECGRAITGPYGWLVTTALHSKNTYKNYIGVDANMANLMRPGMYGAYHHITVLGKEDAPADCMYDIVGSLCENNDKFAIDRKLPQIEQGDILIIHDTGAHGHAMGFNYNGKLRSAELLLRPDGNVIEIRRAENYDDLFTTLDFDEVNRFA